MFPFTNLVTTIENTVNGHVWGWDGLKICNLENLSAGTGFFVYSKEAKIKLDLLRNPVTEKKQKLENSNWHLAGPLASPPYSSVDIKAAFTNVERKTGPHWAWDGASFRPTDTLSPWKAYWIRTK